MKFYSSRTTSALERTSPPGLISSSDSGHVGGKPDEAGTLHIACASTGRDAAQRASIHRLRVQVPSSSGLQVEGLGG